MSYFNHIGNLLGRNELRKVALKPRQKAVYNFGNARSIALVYREKGESFFILVKQYVQFLKNEYGIKEVLALCYIDDKKVVPHYHVHRLKYDYFTRKNVNWRSKPDCDEVSRFVERDFDILIDLEKESCLPLQFVVAQSRASFKVGYYNEDWKELYDLMLKTAGKTTFDGYVDQVNHYLNVIDTRHARA
jgi:hypothetical protein